MIREDRVTASVLRRMSELASAFPGIETGAIGLGPDPFTLTHLIPSGPEALRTPSSFGLDPDFLNPRLRDGHELGLRWIAVWHVHPEGCPFPSDTDCAAAYQLLSDEEAGLNGRLLLPISERSGAGIVTRFFVVERSWNAIAVTAPAIVDDVLQPAIVLPSQAERSDVRAPVRKASHLGLLRPFRANLIQRVFRRNP